MIRLLHLLCKRVQWCCFVLEYLLKIMSHRSYAWEHSTSVWLHKTKEWEFDHNSSFVVLDSDPINWAETIMVYFSTCTRLLPYGSKQVRSVLLKQTIPIRMIFYYYSTIKVTEQHEKPVNFSKIIKYFHLS